MNIQRLSLSWRPFGAALMVIAGTFTACLNPDLDPAPEIETGVALSLAESRRAAISNLHYELEFEIPADHESEIHASMRASFELNDLSAPLQLDFRENGEKIRSVRVNDEASSYQFEKEHLVIPRSELVDGPNAIEIDFIAGDSSLNRNPEYLYTLFVPDRARTAFPLFDQPNLKATYQLTLSVPVGWTALANAPLSSLEEDDERRKYRFQTSDLISSYLFSFVAGQFEEISRARNGRQITMLHRETDAEKVARNVDALFDLHFDSLDWLESYTGIPYPFQKLDFALIPDFQYGGMEHVGAIQYRASTLMLDEAPSTSQLLSRASLIAHETAHMWFGNLVTMDWFNDVWTKEVYANFMAAKIVNPSFPEVDHDLNFLVRHYPSAYAVDRSQGANPIRQELGNLAEAGQMYGAIIYNKAPIMMRQLELILGEENFRDGIREYLRAFSFANATWPDLIRILDARTDTDLAAWSEVWVNSPGRPEFSLLDAPNDLQGHRIHQLDPAGDNRVWPQQFSILVAETDASKSSRLTVLSSDTDSTLDQVPESAPEQWIFNSDGLGYGLFPASLPAFDAWTKLPKTARGSLLIHLFENLMEDRQIEAEAYADFLLQIVTSDQDQLLLSLAADQLEQIFVGLLSTQSQQRMAARAGDAMWRAMLAQDDESGKKLLFEAFSRLASGDAEVAKIHRIWNGELKIEGLKLGEQDAIALAEILAIRQPDRADQILARQLAETANPDRRRRLEFIGPSLSPDPQVRDAFFASLADEKMRRTESWVLDALRNLHHPARTAESQKYILPSLELLQEIQITGDIFFPKRWLDATLENHHSAEAVADVETFLAQRPEYNPRLRMKILQAADLLFRARKYRANHRSNS